MSLGNRINEIRKEKGISIDELCARSGVPKGTLSKITADITTNPTLDTVRAIAVALNCQLDDFDDPPRMVNHIPVSPEAMELAKDYDNLDVWGQNAVRSIADIEKKRVFSEQQKNIDYSEIEFNPIHLPVSPYKASAGEGTFLFDEEPDTIISVINNNDTRKADICITVAGDSMEPVYFDGDILLIRRQPDIDIGEIGIFIQAGHGFVKKKGKDRLISLNKLRPDIYPSEFDEIYCFGKVIGKLKPEWIVEQ